MLVKELKEKLATANENSSIKLIDEDGNESELSEVIVSSGQVSLNYEFESNSDDEDEDDDT